MRVEYRVSRWEDFVRFGIVLHHGMRPVGWTAWSGRCAVGLGGVVIDTADGGMGHFSVLPAYRDVVGRGLHRRTLKLLRRLGRTRIRTIWATCDLDTPRAAEWMARLGFLPSGEVHDGQLIHMKEFVR